MQLGEWICGRVIETLDNRGSDKRGSTVHSILFYSILYFYSACLFNQTCNT